MKKSDELKVQAYNHIATIEAHQNEIKNLQVNLKKINDAIGQALQEEAVQPANPTEENVQN